MRAELPRKISVGTKTMPPPTPNSAESTPASRPSTTATNVVRHSASFAAVEDQEDREREHEPPRATR